MRYQFAGLCVSLWIAGCGDVPIAEISAPIEDSGVVAVDSATAPDAGIDLAHTSDSGAAADSGTAADLSTTTDSAPTTDSGVTLTNDAGPKNVLRGTVVSGTQGIPGITIHPYQASTPNTTTDSNGDFVLTLPDGAPRFIVANGFNQVATLRSLSAQSPWDDFVMPLFDSKGLSDIHDLLTVTRDTYKTTVVVEFVLDYVNGKTKGGESVNLVDASDEGRVGIIGGVWRDAFSNFPAGQSLAWMAFVNVTGTFNRFAITTTSPPGSVCTAEDPQVADYPAVSGTVTFIRVHCRDTP